MVARRHGCHAPFGAYQIIGFVLFPAISATVMLVPVAALPYPGRFIAYGILGLMIFAVVSLGLYLTLYDPRKEALHPTAPNTPMRWCSYCVGEVALNSKHCRVCDRCVHGFDHHCMWLNNCIGVDNYNTFFTFVRLVTLTLGLELLVCLWGVAGFFFNEEEVWSEDTISTIPGETSPKVGLGVSLGSALILLVFTGLVGHLWGFHVTLRRRGITTYDYIMEQRAVALEQEETKKAIEMDRMASGDNNGPDEPPQDAPSTYDGPISPDGGGDKTKIRGLCCGRKSVETSRFKKGRKCSQSDPDTGRLQSPIPSDMTSVGRQPVQSVGGIPGSAVAPAPSPQTPAAIERKSQKLSNLQPLEVTAVPQTTPLALMSPARPPSRVAGNVLPVLYPRSLYSRPETPAGGSEEEEERMRGVGEENGKMSEKKPIARPTTTSGGTGLHSTLLNRQFSETDARDGSWRGWKPEGGNSPPLTPERCRTSMTHRGWSLASPTITGGSMDLRHGHRESRDMAPSTRVMLGPDARVSWGRAGSASRPQTAPRPAVLHQFETSPQHQDSLLERVKSVWESFERLSFPHMEETMVEEATSPMGGVPFA